MKSSDAKAAKLNIYIYIDIYMHYNQALMCMFSDFTLMAINRLFSLLLK